MTLTLPIPVGAVVRYHGSIEEWHGLYTVTALVNRSNGIRLVLEQGEIVLSNVRAASVSMPLLRDFEPSSRHSQAEADAINAVRQHAIRV